MGWIEILRRTEEQSKGAAHRGLDLARNTWEDAERRLRRKMRVFPGKAKWNAAPSRPIGPGNAEAETEEATFLETGTKKTA